MWFFFGFITLGAFCISSLIWRRKVSWHGEQKQTSVGAYELGLKTYKGKVSTARIGVACGEGFSFTLTPEDALDRFAKAIDLTEECQTGDAAFDDAIYVVSDDRVLHRMLQTDAALRADILKLVEDCPVIFGKLQSIEVHRGRAWIVTTPRERARDDVEAASRRMVPLLRNIADRLMRPQAEGPEARDPFPFRAACILAVSTGLAINAALAFIRTAAESPFLLDNGEPFPWALLLGVGAILLLVLTALAWMGRSARTHFVLIELILIGTFGAVVSAYAELRDYDIDLDRSAPEVIHASVIRLYETYSHHKGHTTRHCHMWVQGWPMPDDRREREVDCDFYARLAVGTPIDVEQHAGSLGWPWVAGFTAR